MNDQTMADVKAAMKMSLWELIVTWFAVRRFSYIDLVSIPMVFLLARDGRWLSAVIVLVGMVIISSTAEKRAKRAKQAAMLRAMNAVFSGK